MSIPSRSKTAGRVRHSVARIALTVIRAVLENGTYGRGEWSVLYPVNHHILENGLRHAGCG